MTPFQPGDRRRLRDAQRFDDSLGYGFAYAVRATHGQTAPDVWVHDCWIVDQHGRRRRGWSRLLRSGFATFSTRTDDWRHVRT